jgi:hypothetical protein
MPGLASELPSRKASTIGWILLALLVLLAVTTIVLAIRTALYRRRHPPRQPIEGIPVDEWHPRGGDGRLGPILCQAKQLWGTDQMT